ncbi:MAG TPA: hypothetical protein EYQ50_17595 [Verrucomicrobiales bacterium]|nr:hypothetical protein [Verrucomicrobiales bacterium]
MIIEERARRYIAKMPEAIPGQHGHSTMFKVACILVQGFSLDMASAGALLGEYNSTLTEPFTDREMEHKLKDAAKAQSAKGNGYLLNPSDKPIRVRINPKNSADTPLPIIHQVIFGTLGTGVSYGMTKTIQNKEYNKTAGESKTPVSTVPELVSDGQKPSGELKKAVPTVPDEVIDVSDSTWALAEKFAREFSGRIISPEEVNLPTDYWKA